MNAGTVADRGRLRDWLAAAARAPSPHNVQPARWRCAADGIEQFEDTARWLSVGDPCGRDNRISLGMAWEALALAMSAEGLGLAEPTLAPAPYPPPANDVRLVASAARRDGVEADPLARWQSQRRSWRGRFPAADATQQQRLDGIISAHGEVALRIPDGQTEAIATLHGDATLALLDDPAFADELYRWVRFAGFGRRWHRDGLSTACLDMPLPVGWGANLAMRPRVQRLLARAGLLGGLVSERTQTLSATALALIHAGPGDDSFDTGRRWYRFWLALTAAGFAALPMSAVVDQPDARRALLERIALPAGRQPTGLMRIGPAPVGPVPASARLPLDELLLKDA